MSIQITVRLPDALVQYVDELVARGEVPSRATAVAGALDRDRRRSAALRDAAILAAEPTDTDLESLAQFNAAVSLKDLA